MFELLEKKFKLFDGVFGASDDSGRSRTASTSSAACIRS